jgi:protein O-GlcNAc transferase
MRMTVAQAIEVALQHHQAGRLREAEVIYRQVLAREPRNADALHLLGMLAHQAGQHEQAIGLIGQAIAAAPAVAHYHSNLGNVLRAVGRLDEAVVCYCQSLALDPCSAEANLDLGGVLHQQGRLDQAVEHYEKAIQIKPEWPQAHNNLGVALRGLDRLAEAEACFGKALALHPGYVDAKVNLASLCGRRGRPEDGIELCRAALLAQPRHGMAHLHVGNIQLEMGCVEAAVESLRAAVSLMPGYATAHSNLLYAMALHPRVDAAMLREEQARWNARHAAALSAGAAPHGNDRSPRRPLRIGYVSPDLRLHPVGRLMEALLAHHDHQQFHITAYSDAIRPDAYTQRLRQCCDCWRETASLGDEDLARLVRQDKVDVLVDLSVHSSGNRLLAFARRPAPVQVTYLGYAASTGLEAMDYRLTDRSFSPIGAASEGPEKLIYLPECFWCYAAPENAPPVNALPAAETGRLTFASFNNFAKVNADVVRVWAELLRAVPESSLRVILSGGQSSEHVWRAFERQGVARRRLELLPRCGYEEYWNLYGGVDIALDPFPFNGGVTSLDSVYMGVPVITLRGDRAVARAGASVLSNLGLPELIASTPEQYVRLAAELAGHLPRLKELRMSLRQRLCNSPLMDARRFARDIEEAYRGMWVAWCDGA